MAHAAVSIVLSDIRLYANRLFAGKFRLYRVLGYSSDREEVCGGGMIVHMRKIVSTEDDQTDPASK